MTVYWIQRAFEEGEEYFDVYKAIDGGESVCVATESSTEEAWRTARIMAHVRTEDAIYTTLPSWVELAREQNSARACWMEKQ